MSVYEPHERTALDGIVWWVPFNTKTGNYSHLLCHGKYKTKKKCQQAINYYHNHPYWGRYASATPRLKAGDLKNSESCSSSPC